MEKCLDNPDIINVEEWQSFAKTKGGLIAGLLCLGLLKASF